MPEPFEDRFINLMEPRYAAGGVDLRARVELALAAAPAGGPLTVYLAAELDLSGVLELPERITWFMGPGSSLTLRRGARFDVLGEVDLAFEPRFFVEGGAQVRLLGPLEVIRPEWWIGSADEMLRHAVDLVVERARRRRDAVPVVLTGPYVLQYPIDLTRSAGGAPIAFEFRGRHPVGDGVLAPTLIRGPSMSTTAPLVFARDVGPVRFEHVAFDTTESDDREPDPVNSAPAVEAWGGEGSLDLARCSFFGVKAVAVAGQSAPEPRRVTAKGCWFQVGTSVRTGQYGVRCTGKIRLRLDGCTFVGRASVMVELISGMLDVVGCLFDNRPGATGAGVDIGVTDPAPAFEVIKQGGLFKVPVGDASRLAAPEVTVDWVQINEVHVRTRSVRHLSSTSVRRPTTVALTAVVQELTSELLFSGFSPSAIEWHAAMTSAMLLQGCYFAVPISVARPGRVLAVGTLLQGVPAFHDGTDVSWRYPRS